MKFMRNSRETKQIFFRDVVDNKQRFCFTLIRLFILWNKQDLKAACWARVWTFDILAHYKWTRWIIRVSEQSSCLCKHQQKKLHCSTLIQVLRSNIMFGLSTFYSGTLEEKSPAIVYVYSILVYICDNHIQHNTCFLSIY